MRPLLALGMVSLLHGCAPGGRGADTKQFTLAEDLRIGGADTGMSSFSGIAGLGFDPQGNVWVLDRQTMELRVFDRTGKFLRTIGRSGSGPGEFEGLNGFGFGPGGLVWLPDFRLHRYTVLDTSGRYVATHSDLIRSYGWLWEGTIDDQGRLIDVPYVRDSSGSRQVFRRFRDTSLAVADSFPTHTCARGPWVGYELKAKNGAMMMSVPYAPVPQWDLGGDGRLWCTDGATFAATGTDLSTGDTVATISYMHPRLPVTPQMRDSQVARIQKSAREMGAPDPDFTLIPQVQPAIQQLLVDGNGRVWLRTPTPTPEETHYDLFDRDGKPIGEVKVPFRLEAWSPIAFRGDTVLAVVQDADDVPTVLRLHLAPAPPTP
jgi:hypothetical protein